MGTGGIEKEFEEELRGVRGSQTIIRSPGGRMITVLEGSEQPPVNGSSVVLTIDKEYQSILEEELEAGLKSSGGKYAVGIILDPNTGEVLALANEKSYDPGKYNLVDDETRRNKAVTDVYEPGSTFKAIAMAAMLDKDLVHPEELIFVDNGSYRFKGITIRDVHGYNSLTVKGVFAKSSNIGMAKLSGRIKKEDLYKYVRGFGFGNTTQISLPGEVRGLLKHPNLWSAYTKVTMSYGYEIAVTPIQLISAYAAVINGGVLYKPQIVKRIELPNGNAVKQFEPEQVRRVISEETSTVMREFLKEVVENGTGKNAHIEGVSIGGKTGTSRRVVDGKYSYSQYNASFIGFFPAEKPSYIILIMVNSPKNGYYGGTVAAPIFKKITERMLHNHPLPEEYDDEDLPENRLPNPMNVFNTNDSETTESEFAFEEHNPLGRITDNRKMPDLKGLSIREAVLVLSELQLEYRIKGTGPVYNQSIKAGTVLKDEMICTIHGEALTVLNRRLY
jgi:cell division protein FtsI/penicillin-binding protein 2